MSISLLGDFAGLANTIINRLMPDKTQAEKDKAALLLQDIQVNLAQAQMQADVNKSEAASATGVLGHLGALWVAGWRPGVGWSCALAFFWSYVLCPMLTFGARLAGHPVEMPALDISGMMPVMLGMLGLGWMRTNEKLKGLNPGE